MKSRFVFRVFLGLTSLFAMIFVLPVPVIEAEQPLQINTDTTSLKPTSMFSVPAGRAVTTQDDLTVQYIDQAIMADLGEFSVYPALGRTYYLQAKDGKEWKNLETYHTSPKTVYYSFRPEVPMPTSEKTVEYRVYAPKGTYDAEFISYPVKVSYQKFNTFEQERAEIKSAIGDYCGLDTKVAYAAPLVDPVAGMYMPNTKTLLFRGDLTGEELEYVSLHECAHSVQDRTARANGYSDMKEIESLLDPIYGDFGKDVPYEAESGIEQNADCMTFLMGTSYEVGGYIDASECTGEKKDAAIAMLKGNLP